MLRTLLATGVIALGTGLAGTGAALADYTTADLNMRTCGSTSCGRVGVIPGGAYVDVLGQRGNWLRVNYNGRVGWASASYISDGPVRRRSYSYYQPRVPFFGFTYYNNDWGWRHRNYWRGRSYRNRHWSGRSHWNRHRGGGHHYRRGVGPWVTWR